MVTLGRHEKLHLSHRFNGWRDGDLLIWMEENFITKKPLVMSWRRCNQFQIEAGFPFEYWQWNKRVLYHPFGCAGQLKNIFNLHVCKTAFLIKVIVTNDLCAVLQVHFRADISIHLELRFCQLVSGNPKSVSLKRFGPLAAPQGNIWLSLALNASPGCNLLHICLVFMGFTAEDSCLLWENQSGRHMWSKHSKTNREINKALYGWKRVKSTEDHLCTHEETQ